VDTTLTDDARPADGAAAALPSHWYTDQLVFERELERIFERTWQCIGVVDALSSSGDYISGQVGRVPVVVVRDERNQLRAFVNVCLHRCSVIVEGCGNGRTLQCPYHAWTYNLDGQLVGAPRFKDEPGFDLAAFRLEEVGVACLGPFVMVNLDPAAPSLIEQLDGLEERMAPDGLVFEGLAHVGRWESEQDANWKVLVENFNECYHCPVAHPEFSRLLAVDPDHYALETTQWTSRAVVPLRPGGRQAVADYPEGGNELAQYALVWPAFTLSQSPGPRRVNACWFEPLTPGRTRMVCETYADPAARPEDIAALDAFSTRVTLEDQTLVEAVQRGLRSGRVQRGRLMLGSERLVAHFDQLVADALADPPSQG
jgi:phenylpropionate dioxygenase-like ring-hydroxylating dioxygenase large terminal subunit